MSKLQNTTQLKQKIKKILRKEKKKWKHLIYGKGILYQSLEELGLEGQRDTNQRIKDYNFVKYLKKSDDVLDIGGNTGFIDLQISPNINSADVVEINPFQCEIGEIVRDFSDKIDAKKVNFFPWGFEDFGFEGFKTNKKYSVVFCFAVDEVADGLSKLSFNNFLNKIDSITKPNAYIFFESQAEDIMMKKWDKKSHLLKARYEVIEEKKISSTYPSNVKERVFLVLKKK